MSGPIPTVPKGLPPIPGQRAVDEQALAMIVSLASELIVARARLDAFERLLIANGTLAAGAIDAFEPDAESGAAREALRLYTMKKIFRPLQEAAEFELAGVVQQEVI